MSFPRYLRYRETGADWLGAVPGHWTLRRLAHYFNERREKVSDKIFRPLSVTKRGIVPQLETAAKSDDSDNRKLVLAGDFVINSRSDRKGSSGLSEYNGSVSLINTVLEPNFDVNGRFAHHLFRSVAFQEEFYRFGKGIVADLWSTNFSEMRNILLAVPPLPEQTAIATFLDRETAKIEALVGEQRRLIDLLKEKRQAVISHAVTKGLDPMVPMRDSGVEWLGEVPAHWNVKPLKYLTPPDRTIMYGIVLPGPDVGSGIPIVKGGDVKEHRLSRDTLCWTTAEIEAPYARARLRPDDIVYSIRGSIGDAELVPAELLDANITQDVARISPISDVNPHWLLQVMRSQPVFVQLEQRSIGAAVRGINIYDLKRACIPVPTREEQDAIAEELSIQLGKLSKLEKAVGSSISLMQEHRAALISAAVTGKIDVRSQRLVEVEAA